MSRTASLLFAFVVPLSTVFAQSSAIPIGGHGSLSSEGYDDPGLLGDGETQGRARLEFTLDVPGSTLTLVVQNYSPVKPGVPNPVMTRVYFNTPPGITGMTLVSQSAAEGDVEPAFELEFDAQRSSAPNPNGVGRLGAFNAQLDNGDGVHGAIANAAADTIAPGDPAIGPVTFVLALQGDLSGVDVDDFVSERSSNPPGDESVVAACKFQSGGKREASAFISGGDPFCELAAQAEDLGGGCGPRLVCNLPVQGEMWRARVESAPPGALGVLVISPLPSRPVRFHGCDILVDVARGYRLALFTTDANGEGGVAMKVKSYYYSVECCGIEGIVQVGFRTGTTFQGATNACRIRLGS